MNEEAGNGMAIVRKKAHFAAQNRANKPCAIDNNIEQRWRQSGCLWGQSRGKTGYLQFPPGAKSCVRHCTPRAKKQNRVFGMRFEGKIGQSILLLGGKKKGGFLRQKTFLKNFRKSAKKQLTKIFLYGRIYFQATETCLRINEFLFLKNCQKRFDKFRNMWYHIRAVKF